MTKSSQYENYQQTDQSKLRNENNTPVGVISQRIRHCTIAGSSNNDAIAGSTSAPKYFSDESASMLSARADTLAKPKYAIIDAMKALKYHPRSPRGYVTSGDIYTIQEKQKAAIDILESRLRLLPPSEQTLLDERLAIEKRVLEQGIDFVAKLPLEIVVNIFALTSLGGRYMTLVNCTTVSKLWRHILLQQCPELWRTITIVRDSFSSPVARLLPKISAHVQNLTVCNVNESILKKLDNIGASHKFPSITSLTFSTGSPKLLMSLLRDTLTSLTICIQLGFPRSVCYYSNEHPEEFPLDQVLSSCSNLKDVSITSEIWVTYRRPKVSSFEGYQLTSLYIKTPYPLDMLEGLIPLCPRLEKLFILGEFSPTVMSLVERHCPLLVNLMTVETPSTNKLISTNKDNEQFGLYATLQCQISTTLEALALKSIITKSTKELTTLDLRVINPDTFQDGLEQLAAIKLDQVINLGLSLCGRGAQFGNFVQSIIRHCPLLEAVIIDFQNATIPYQLFEGLTSHRRLHTLEVSYIKSYTSGLQQLLTHLSALGSECMLKNVTVEFSNIVNDEVLTALGSIQTLQAIQVACPHGYDNVTIHGVSAFITKLKAMPRLKKLRLGSMPYITHSMICLLAEKSGLETLILTSIDGITSDGVRAMANRLCASLKTVRVTGRSIDCDAYKYLQEAIRR